MTTLLHPFFLFMTFAILQGMDVEVTIYALTYGLTEEANPLADHLFRSFGVVIPSLILKSVYLALVGWWIIVSIKKGNTAYKWVMPAICLFYLAAIVNNLSLIGGFRG